MSLIRNTLFAKYLKEKDGIETLENEFGFIGYKITGEECYITQMFTEPSVRGSGKGRELLSALEHLSKSAGCKFIATNIWYADAGASNTMGASLKAGFKLRFGDARGILITKEIEGA
jgi:GNAT superfamily N-acetyltransferase